VVGGLSGTGLEHPQALTDLVRDLGIADVVRFVPAQSQRELADWYCAASLVCVPSRSETFGLVALEAQACGTPVVAAGVGGLTTAVRDGRSGVLVDGHDPYRWAGVIDDLLASPDRQGALRAGALSHAGGFGWSRTAVETLAAYIRAAQSVWSERTVTPLAPALP
jgi:D-inositol-3-phosphate glycosyltransferase